MENHLAIYGLYWAVVALGILAVCGLIVLWLGGAR